MQEEQPEDEVRLTVILGHGFLRFVLFKHQSGVAPSFSTNCSSKLIVT